MRHFPILLLAAMSLMSCDQSEQTVTVSEKRQRTFFDERFAANMRDHPPLSWRRIPGTQFRLKNYVAGPEEAVEVFIGQTQGDVLGNANRWLGQFGVDPAGNLEAFEMVPVLEAQSFLIEAEGDYESGMGQPKREQQALVGVIRPQAKSVITIKMVGPKDAVVATRDEFLKYCKTIELHAPQFIPEGNEFQDTES